MTVSVSFSAGEEENHQPDPSIMGIIFSITLSIIPGITSIICAMPRILLVTSFISPASARFSFTGSIMPYLIILDTPIKKSENFFIASPFNFSAGAAINPNILLETIGTIEFISTFIISGTTENIFAIATILFAVSSTSDVDPILSAKLFSTIPKATSPVESPISAAVPVPTKIPPTNPAASVIPPNKAVSPANFITETAKLVIASANTPICSVM